ncbi:hypothetical protein BLL04_17815 [Klebsiella variicola]|nr:hypothetical protein BLL04_17815 [Klebsiella variicola]
MFSLVRFRVLVERILTKPIRQKTSKFRSLQEIYLTLLKIFFPTKLICFSKFKSISYDERLLLKE